MKLLITFALTLIINSIPNAVAAQSNREIFVRVTAQKNGNDFTANLKAQDFQLKLNNILQTVTSFGFDDEPISVCILIDESGSMDSMGKSNSAERVLDTLKNFVNTANAKNEYFLIGFKDKPELVVSATMSRDALLKGLEVITTIKPKGNTAFYDSVKFSLDNLSGAKYSRHVLLVISDGIDNVSQTSLGDVQKSLKLSGTLLYSISLRTGFSGLEGSVLLDNLAASSGGKSFYVYKQRDLESAVASILKELKTQYKVGFIPVGQKPGKWNKLQIDLSEDLVKNQKVKLHYREGIFIDTRQLLH